MRILDHTGNFFLDLFITKSILYKISLLFFGCKSHIMRTCTVLRIIWKFSEERVTPTKKKLKRASIYSCLSSYNEGGRGFLFIVYSAKLMLLNGWFQFSSYTCSSDNIFIKAHVFPCKYEKINFDDEAFVRTAKIG